MAAVRLSVAVRLVIGHQRNRERAAPLVALVDIAMPASMLNSRQADIAGGQFNSTQGNVTNLTINCPPGEFGTLAPLLVEVNSAVPTRDSQASSTLRISRRSNVVYEQHLTTKRIGYPLWIPQPNKRLPVCYRRQGVSIGDVGILGKTGGFDFLFNILFPTESAINPRQMPGNFFPLDPPLDDIDICEYTEFDEGSYLASGSAEHSYGRRSDSKLSFKSCASEGAILTMPSGANSQDVANVARLRAYVAEHAEDWYKYANGIRGREARNGDLRLVIGCDKTSAWGMATFQNVSQVDQCELRFLASQPQPMDSSSTAPIKYVWEQSGHAEAKAGPTLKESTELKQGDPTIGPDELYENQCLFVRTLNIMLGEDIWARLQSTTTVMAGDKSEESSGTRNLSTPLYGLQSTGTGQVVFDTQQVAPKIPHESTEEGGTCGSRDDDIFVTSSALALDCHPADNINRELLRMYPNAKIAITGDNEWGRLRSSEPSKPASFLFQVMKSQDIWEQNGIVSLQPKDAKITELDGLLASIREGQITLEQFLAGENQNCFSIFRMILNTLESHYQELNGPSMPLSLGTPSSNSSNSFPILQSLLEGLYSDVPAKTHQQLGPEGNYMSAGELWHAIYFGLCSCLLLTEPDQKDNQCPLFLQLTYAQAQLFFSTGLYEYSTEAILLHMEALSGAKYDRLLSSKLNLQLFFLLSKRYLITGNLNDLQAAIEFLKKQQLHCHFQIGPVNMDYGPQDVLVIPAHIDKLISQKITNHGKEGMWPYPKIRDVEFLLSQFSEEGNPIECADASQKIEKYNEFLHHGNTSGIQTYNFSALAENRSARCIATSLPKELWLNILSMVPCTDLVQVILVGNRLLADISRPLVYRSVHFRCDAPLVDLQLDHLLRRNELVQVLKSVTLTTNIQPGRWVSPTLLRACHWTQPPGLPGQSFGDTLNQETARPTLNLVPALKMDNFTHRSWQEGFLMLSALTSVRQVEYQTDLGHLEYPILRMMDVCCKNLTHIIFAGTLDLRDHTYYFFLSITFPKLVSIEFGSLYRSNQGDPIGEAITEFLVAHPCIQHLSLGRHQSTVEMFFQFYRPLITEGFLPSLKSLEGFPSNVQLLAECQVASLQALTHLSLFIFPSERENLGQMHSAVLEAFPFRQALSSVFYLRVEFNVDLSHFMETNTTSLHFSICNDILSGLCPNITYWYGRLPAMSAGHLEAVFMFHHNLEIINLPRLSLLTSMQGTEESYFGRISQRCLHLRKVVARKPEHTELEDLIYNIERDGCEKLQRVRVESVHRFEVPHI